MGHSFTRTFGIFFLIVGTLEGYSGLTEAPQRPGLPSYAIVELGSLGGTTSEASGLNSFGDVVGGATTTDGAAHAVLYRNGETVDLGVLPGGTSSHATAINDRGLIVGYGGINAFGPQFREFVQAFAWQDGTMQAIGALYCRCSFNVRYGTSRAFAVSRTGLIVGDSETSRAATRHAFVREPDMMRDLGLEIGRPGSSHAYGINDLHEVVGDIDDRAALVRDGVSFDLGVLPGSLTASARAVNNKGQVVGTSVNAAGVSHAFIWDLATMGPLAPLTGDASSEALAINVNGEIVGRSGNADLSESRAVLWRHGVAIDLSRVTAAHGWTLATATAINDLGQIAGTGLRDGSRRAFLLNPR